LGVLIFVLFFQTLKLPPLAVKLGLVGFDLTLLLYLLVFLALQLIAHQRAGAKTKSPAHSGADAGGADRGTDDASYRCAAQRANTRAFLARRERAAGTTRAGGQYDKRTNSWQN
jgi:hypothetical protein